jgi:predicted PhzF superfamily epimerase YddE/YHI9
LGLAAAELVTWRIPPRVALSGVDAFTDRPFGGNPAMVCLLPGPAGDGWMQWAAAELN